MADDDGDGVAQTVGAERLSSAGAGLQAAKPKKPRAKLTQDERTELSDKRMFSSAMQLICEQGAHRTTLKEICEKAGYSRGLANYRFGSKDAFFGKLIEHFNLAWSRELSKYIGKKRGAEAIFAAIDAFEGFLLEFGSLMRGRYIIMYESIATDNLLSRKLTANHKAYHLDIETWFKEGVEDGSISSEMDSSAFASYYCSFIFGTVFQWLVSRDQVDIAALCKYFRQQVKKSLDGKG